MIPRIFIAIGLLVLPLTGAAADDWPDAATRMYPDATTEQVLAAAEQVFGHSDFDNFEVQRTANGVPVERGANGMRVKRKWSLQLIVTTTTGTDRWALTVEPDGAGVRAFMHLTLHSDGFAPALVTTERTMAVTLNRAEAAFTKPVHSTAIYDLFWARVDHFLGRRDTWLSCETAAERASRGGETRGSIDSLCRLIDPANTAPQGARIE